jgi:hypothetical protein
VFGEIDMHLQDLCHYLEVSTRRTLEKKEIHSFANGKSSSIELA